jgi:hypothetical protein
MYQAQHNTYGLPKWLPQNAQMTGYIVDGKSLMHHQGYKNIAAPKNQTEGFWP